MKQWEWGYPGGAVSKPKSHDAVMKEVRTRLRRTMGPYRQKRRGDRAWGPRKSLPNAIRSLDRNTRDDRVGDVQVIESRNGVRVFVRCVEVIEQKVPPIPYSGATQTVKEMWKVLFTEVVPAVEKRLGYEVEVVYMGIFNCRRIDDSWQWSQHAWANALDFRLRRKYASSGSIDNAAMDIAMNLMAQKFPWNPLWRVAGHTFHGHVGGPPKTGIPSCA